MLSVWSWRVLMERLMPTVAALEFQRKLGHYQHQAQREPVEITRHGRREFVLMPAEHYDRLRAAAERSHRTADAPENVLRAMAAAERWSLVTKGSMTS